MIISVLDIKYNKFCNYIDGKKPEDDFTKELDDAVNKVRSNEKWRLEYMTLQMMVLIHLNNLQIIKKFSLFIVKHLILNICKTIPVCTNTPSPSVQRYYQTLQNHFHPFDEPDSR